MPTVGLLSEQVGFSSGFITLYSRSSHRRGCSHRQGRAGDLGDREAPTDTNFTVTDPLPASLTSTVRPPIHPSDTRFVLFKLYSPKSYGGDVTGCAPDSKLAPPHMN